MNHLFMVGAASVVSKQNIFTQVNTAGTNVLSINQEETHEYIEYLYFKSHSEDSLELQYIHNISAYILKSKDSVAQENCKYCALRLYTVVLSIYRGESCSVSRISRSRDNLTETPVDNDVHDSTFSIHIQITAFGYLENLPTLKKCMKSNVFDTVVHVKQDVLTETQNYCWVCDDDEY